MSSARGRLIGAIGLVVVLGVAFGLYWFAPWRLFTHSRVDEALPGYSSSGPAPSALARTSSGGTRSTPLTPSVPSKAAVPSTAAVAPVVVSRTAFRSGEHSTSGTALLIRLPDGHLVIRLENFSTSDGPDVRVILSKAPAGSDAVDRYVHLGHLKATSGNQNYSVPVGTFLSDYRSVVIWCKRFDAVFGSADLTAV